MNGNKPAVRIPDQVIAFFKGNRSRALLFIGIAGMALIFLSTVIPAGAGKPNPSVGAAQQSPEEYVADLEKRLAQLVGKVDGVGRCEVMVTLENGIEYVYAVEESKNVNQTNSYDGSDVRRETQQQNMEQKYIVVDTGSGKKEALLKTQRQPTVQGVVVVCEGASSTVVQERVTQVVATALGVPYNRVCVTKISK